jgi:hypothetical protein
MCSEIDLFVGHTVQVEIVLINPLKPEKEAERIESGGGVARDTTF